MQQIIRSYLQSQTINSNFHHTSSVKGSLVNFVTFLKYKTLVKLLWYLKLTPHIP